MHDRHPPHLIVTGFGRCGTTMVMTMLDAGGFPVAGPRPSYEVPAAFGPGRIDGAWLDRQAGRAVKIIDPTACPIHRHRFAVPPVVICMERNLTQQARSQVMFATGAAKPSRHMVKAMARSLAKDTPAMRARLGRVAGATYHEAFENVLDNPARMAGLLAMIARQHFGRPFDEAAATRVVLPRPHTCRPDHMIENHLLPLIAQTLRPADA